MVESFGLEERVIYEDPSKKEIIFAINAKTPDATDFQTAEKLRKLMLSKLSARKIRLPINYHSVELILKKKVQETDRIAFNVSDILKDVAHFYFDTESLKKALRHLHVMKLIFYFEEIFPDKVMGDPQAIYDKHTELVVYHIKMATDPMEQSGLDATWRKFLEKGILNVRCLEMFPDRYDITFTPANMMTLFEELLIVSELSNGEYLMPCVLPVVKISACNSVSELVRPMVLHFKKGIARYGIFCATVCHLLTVNKWKLFKEVDAEDPHITRNSIHFSVPNSPMKISLIDPFDSFFLVTVHAPPHVLGLPKGFCTKVRDTLIYAIDVVTKKLNYSQDTPEVAFLCEHQSSSPHPAIVLQDYDFLQCTESPNVDGGELTTKHHPWLKGTYVAN